MEEQQTDGLRGQAGQNLWPTIGSLLFLVSIFFVTFMGRTATAPLLPSLEQDLGFLHTQAGSLFLYLSLGYFCGLLGSGYVASSLNHRRTIVLSALTGGASLLAIGFSDSIWGVRLGLLAVGLTTGLYLPSGIAIATSVVTPRHWGKALAIHDMAPNLSFVAAPALASAFLGLISWRGVFFVYGCASVLVSLAFSRWGPGGRLSGRAPGLAVVKSLLKTPSLWILCAVFSVGTIGVAGVYNMLPLFLTAEHHLSESSANLIVALSKVSGIGAALLAGGISDRLGPRRALVGILGITGIMTLLIGLTSGTWLQVIVFLQSAVAVCFFPVGFAALSSIGTFETRNLSVAMIVAVSSLIGMGVVPAGTGLMADLGLFGTGFAISGLLILGGIALLPWLKLSAGLKA